MSQRKISVALAIPSRAISNTSNLSDTIGSDQCYVGSPRSNPKLDATDDPTECKFSLSSRTPEEFDFLLGEIERRDEMKGKNQAQDDDKKKLTKSAPIYTRGVKF